MHFKCCVCGSNKQLHKFPKNAEMKQKWANVLRKMGIRLDCHSRVCSDHFLDSDFYRKSNPTGYHVFKNYLWTLAVPSVFSCNSRSNVHEPPNFGKGEIIFGSQPHSVGPTFSLQDVFKNDTFRGIGIKPEDEMEEDMLPGTSVQGLKVNETNNILIKQDDFCNVVKECCFWITENHQPFLEEDPIFPKQRVEEIDVEINDVDNNDRVNETDPVSLSPSNEIIAVRSHRAQTAKRSSSPSIERKNYNFRLLGDLDYRGVEETDVEIEDHNNILNETDSVNLSPRNEMIAVRKSHIPRTAKRSWSPSIERKNYKEALSDYNDIAHNKTSYEKNSDEEIYVTETVTSPTSLHEDHSPEWTPRKPDSDERTKIVTDSYCRRYSSSTRSGGSLQLAMKNRRDMRSCLGINRFRSIKMKCNDHKEISYESNCDEVIDLTEAVTSPTSLHEDHSPERTPRKPDSDERTKTVTDTFCSQYASKKKDRKRYFERYNRSYDRRNINVIMERNRRSELNQLFDNLRHILPKASNIKIKILHEAVECIRNMQYEHRQLARKLQIYRKKHHSLLRHRAFFDLLDDAF